MYACVQRAYNEIYSVHPIPKPTFDDILRRTENQWRFAFARYAAAIYKKLRIGIQPGIDTRLEMRILSEYQSASKDILRRIRPIARTRAKPAYITFPMN